MCYLVLVVNEPPTKERHVLCPTERRLAELVARVLAAQTAADAPRPAPRPPIWIIR